jgi:hypothetical protein
MVALMNDGRVDGRQVMPASVATMLLTRQVDVPPSSPGENAGYSYGLLERVIGGTRVFQHGGVRIGFGTVVRLIPAHRVGIAIFANRTNAVMTRSLDYATQVFAPSARAENASSTPLPLDSLEAAAAAGHYVNTIGELDLYLIADGRRLELRSGGAKSGLAVRKLGPRQYEAGGNKFALVSGRVSGTQYLFIAGHALRRVEP